MRHDPWNLRNRGRSGMVVHIGNGISRLRRPSEIPLLVTMRVKNEERILPRCLESLRPLDSPVILLDDGSTDKTQEIARSFGFVHYSKQNLADMDELRDRRWLFKQAMSYKPEWVLTLDGDEVLPERTPGEIIRVLDKAPDGINVVELAVAWIWLEKWFVRFESGPFWHHRIYRASNSDPDLPYVGTPMIGTPDFKHGLHCGPLPPMLSPVQKMKVHAYIKAYGYDTPEAVREHLAFYHKYDETFWSQRQIVERLNEPLDPWDDDLVPSERSPESTRELIDRKVELSLLAWGMKTNEQGESQTVNAEVHQKRRPGRPRKTPAEVGGHDHARSVGG